MLLSLYPSPRLRWGSFNPWLGTVNKGQNLPYSFEVIPNRNGFIREIKPFLSAYLTTWQHPAAYASMLVQKMCQNDPNSISSFITTDPEIRSDCCGFIKPTVNESLSASFECRTFLPSTVITEVVICTWVPSTLHCFWSGTFNSVLQSYRRVGKILLLSHCRPQ